MTTAEMILSQAAAISPVTVQSKVSTYSILKLVIALIIIIIIIIIVIIIFIIIINIYYYCRYNQSRL